MIIYSKDMGEQWEEELIVDKEGEIRKIWIVCDDKIPKTMKLTVRLVGRKSRAEIVMPMVIKEDKQLTALITVMHEAPETYARVAVKAAIYAKGSLSLDGRLVIRKEAKGGDSYLLAKALLLSADAMAELKPYLEIATDDVKASHGASVGRLDEEQLFYLRSRGLEKEEAERILLAGFFKKEVEELPINMKQKFFQYV
ncbi:MAG: SufD family Fe-S cluster assembly protein [bacterium]